MLKITKYLILIAGLVLVSHTSFSQTGDEWIVDGQEYYKIPVGKEGIYKIDYANLTTLGPALGDYKYYDMHQTIARALEVFEEIKASIKD